MDIKKLLELTLKNNASDLHIIFGIAPTLRINGELEPITGKISFEKAEIKEAILSILDENQKKIFLKKKELDFSFEFEQGTRFRVNAYHAQGNAAASFRLIKPRIPSIEELNLPEALYQFVDLRQGFVLVAGPTGHGKSTTVAAILEEINKTKKVHIVSIEDPIEYVLQAKKSIISQREIGNDSLSFKNALRSCLREDPNVVFVGEMRDLESIALALTIAETGHLVFSTLHTNSSAQTIDRIIDVFPEGAKDQIRLQLANVLGAVISQRLVPSLNNDQLFPATEILLSNPAIRTAIREGKTHMIDNVIQTSLEAGMITLERSLAVLVRQGKIGLETAQSFALKPEDLNRQLRQEKTRV
ncbi:MAG: type IV pilus twitching motility protein PilT [Patescibacteria group bacterium]